MNSGTAIMSRLQEHLESALAAHPVDWFVICVQGSQNYGLDDEYSDVDTKMLTIPSLRELTLNSKSLNKVHIMENGEHCDIKDVREYFKIFRKSNINFVEILFTDYWIVNEKYEDLWLDLLYHAEKLARYNPYAAVSCMKGMASEKFHALSHEYPSRMAWIEKYGYDPKQLSHLFRIKYFIENYIAGLPYEDCIYLKDSDKRERLLNLKRTGLNLTADCARELAEDCFKDICKKADNFRQFNPNKPDEKLDAYLDNLLFDLVSRSLSAELSNVEVCYKPEEEEKVEDYIG